MSPDEIKTHYRSFMDDVGELVTIRRWYNTGLVRTKFEAEVKARVTWESAGELAGAVHQGDANLIVLVDDLETAQFPLPITTNDRVVVRGRELTCYAVDANTRRVQGVLVAYEIKARG